MFCPRITQWCRAVPKTETQGRWVCQNLQVLRLDLLARTKSCTCLQVWSCNAQTDLKSSMFILKSYPCPKSNVWSTESNEGCLQPVRLALCNDPIFQLRITVALSGQLKAHVHGDFKCLWVGSAFSDADRKVWVKKKNCPVCFHWTEARTYARWNHINDSCKRLNICLNNMFEWFLFSSRPQET